MNRSIDKVIQGNPRAGTLILEDDHQCCKSDCRRRELGDETVSYRGKPREICGKIENIGLVLFKWARQEGEKITDD